MRKKIGARTIKIFGLVLIAVFVMRYMSGDRTALRFIVGLESDNRLFTLVSTLFYWFSFLCFMVTVFNCFYDFKLLKNLNKFVVAPLALLGAILFFATVEGIVGASALETFNLRALNFALELGLVLGGSIVFLIRDWKLKITRKDVIYLLIAILPMLFALMPAYLPRVLFGMGGKMEFMSLSQPHRLVIYIGIIIPFALFFLLRKQDLAIKKCALMFVAFAALIVFSDRNNFAKFADVTDWPVHLCHTVMYIVPLCLLFNWRKLFYFTYFINVVGAFIAMIIPQYIVDGGWTDPSLIYFYLNHWPAYFMPILMVALGVYARPKWKEFRWSMYGFAVYFVFILGINAWFSNYDPEINYFYVYSDFTPKVFGEHGMRIYNAAVWKWQWGDLSFELHPVFQFFFFLIYVGLGFLMWFVYELCYQFADDQNELFHRKNVMKLDYMAFASRMEGRALSEPINKEGENMLKINNFSKKYGSSTRYAVKEANLEVRAGEVFGFLGPNGAGKSTIIKTIVGIQLPTSGTIEVCGYDVVKQDVEAKMRIGFVPDHYALYERLTGREYINYIADIYNVSREARGEWIESLVEKFDLEGAFDNPMKTYSHGMKQKIAIIAALVHKPKLWILDEPLTGLDPTSIHQVKKTMQEYAEAGNIVFFSSHIIDVVERICDRIAIIVKGKIGDTVVVKDLAEKGTKLEEYYLSMIGSNKESKEKDTAQLKKEGKEAEAKQQKKKREEKESKRKRKEK